MICRHCGIPYANPAAVMCVRCGAPKGEGLAFCQACGAGTVGGATVCTGCGVKLLSGKTGTKSRMACGLLGIFVGGLGIHNFMLGYTGKAVAQLCLYVGGWLFSWLLIGIPAIMAAGIWGLIDGIMILSNKEYRDAAGNLLSD